MWYYTTTHTYEIIDDVRHWVFTTYFTDGSNLEPHKLVESIRATSNQVVEQDRIDSMYGRAAAWFTWIKEHYTDLKHLNDDITISNVTKLTTEYSNGN